MTFPSPCRPSLSAIKLRQMVARDFERIQTHVGEMLVDIPCRKIVRRGNDQAASVSSSPLQTTLVGDEGLEPPTPSV